jgi:type VI protein secretion system component VasK
MKTFFRRLLTPVFLGSLALLLLSALVWWILPLFTFGGEHTFDSVGLRAAIIGVLWLLWLAVLLLSAWRRRRTNARLLQGMAGGAQNSNRDAQAQVQRFEGPPP